ncbi:MAG: PilZ domain-containing protein [Myxococcota bacterium]
MAATPSKQRAHPRVATEISVKIRIEGGRTAAGGTIRNISLGGVYIEMDEPPGFGQEMELDFSLPIAPRNIRCNGFVMWSTKNDPERLGGRQGMGVRLTDIGINAMRLLSDYIGAQQENT